MEQRKNTEQAEASRRRELMRRIFFMIMLTGVSVLIILVARFFLIALLLAALSAGIFFPVHNRLRRRFGRRSSLAAMVSTILFCLIILGPVGGLGYVIVDNLTSIGRSVVQSSAQVRTWIEGLESFINDMPVPGGGILLDILNVERLSQLLQRVGSWLLSQVSGLAENVVRLLLMFIVYLYSLYFFIRDGERIIHKISEAIPLPEEDRQAVQGRFLSVTRATLKSTAIIGGIQGLSCGLLYWAVGVRGPVLWGLLIMVFAAIPGIGAVVVWMPISVVLLVMGKYLGAAAVFGAGVTVIPLADVLLRPRLVGRDTQMHPVLVLVGVLGGVSLLGISGLLLGPLIMSVGMVLWNIFKRMFAEELGRS